MHVFALSHQGGYHRLERKVCTRHQVDHLSQDRQNCRALCIDCAAIENRKMFVNHRQIIHLSPETRVRTCQRLGLTIESNPVALALECAPPGPIALWTASITFLRGLLTNPRGYMSCSRNRNGSNLPNRNRFFTRRSIPVTVSSNAEPSDPTFSFWPKCWELTSSSVASSRAKKLGDFTSLSVWVFRPSRKPFFFTV